MRSLYQVEKSPVDTLRLVRQHFGTMLLSFAAVIAITLLYLSTAPRHFKSDAKIYVRIGRESATLDPTATTGQFVGVVDSRESEVYAVEELLSSRILAEKVVDKFSPAVILEKDPNKPGLALGKRLSWLNGYNLNPLRVYSLRDKAVQAFQENLKVSAANKTSVISVSYKCENAQLAKDVLDFFLNVVREEHLQVHRTKGSQEFFVSQAKLLESNLARLEEQYRDVKNKTGLASLPSQREIQLQLSGSLQADLVRARAERDAVEAELQQRRQQLKKLPVLIVTERSSGQPQTTGQVLREKLYDLEIKEQEYSSKFTDINPQLVQLRNQIAEARRIFTEEKVPDEVKRGISQSFQAAELNSHEREAQLVSLTARIESLEGRIASIREELHQINESELTITQLEREIDLARTNYRKYGENLEQARINHELEEAKISSLNLMQSPTFSETPVSPRPLVTLGVGFVLATMGSFGMALLVHRRRPIASAAPSPVPDAGEWSSAPDPVSTNGHGSEVVPANPR